MTAMPVDEAFFCKMFRQITAAGLRSAAARVREMIRSGQIKPDDWEVAMYEMATVMESMPVDEVRSLLDATLVATGTDLTWASP